MAIYKKEYVLNGEVTGELLYSKDTTGWVSGFSSQNTWRIKEVFSPTADQSFEVSVRVRTGSSISSPNIQEIFAIGGMPLLMRIDAKKLSLSYNTGSWSIVGSYSCSTNTEYLTVLKYHPITTTTNGYTYSAKYLYFEIYNSSGDLLHRSSASLNSRFLNFVGDFAYLGSQEGGENWGGRIHNGEDTYIKVDGELWWQPLLEERIDVSGSVEISKGYYSDGSNKISMPASTYNFDALTANQTLGGKNKLFVYTDSMDNVGALITSTTPTGSFKITKQLDKHIYLDPTNNYIAGGEIIEPAVTPTSSLYGVEIVGNVSISNGIASGFSDTAYLEMINGSALFNSATESFEYTTRFKQLSQSSSNEGLLDKGDGTSIDDIGLRLTLTSGKVRFRISQNGSTTYAIDVKSTNTISSGTYYSLRLSYSSTNGYTVSLKEDGSDTWEVWASSTSTVKPFYSEAREYRIGDNTDSGSSLNGSIDLSQTNLIVNGELVWEALPRLNQVSSTKALQYSEAQDTTYWVPSEATVSLDYVKATQSVGMSNRLYLTNNAGAPTASLSFSNNGVINGVDSYMATGLNVYLSDDLTKILNIGE